MRVIYTICSLTLGCESNPCQNGGTCKKGECMCKDNTSGPRCENLRGNDILYCIIMKWIIEW